MFSGTPNPLQTASTPCDSREHHYIQTGSTNNLETETDIDAISRAAYCHLFGHSKFGRDRIDNERIQNQRHMQTSGLGYSFYFRFVPDSVLRSWTLSIPVEVDGRALKHCCSCSDHHDIVFRRKVITTSGICPPSWNFWVKQAAGEVGIYTSKTLSQ